MYKTTYTYRPPEKLTLKKLNPLGQYCFYVESFLSPVTETSRAELKSFLGNPLGYRRKLVNDGFLPKGLMPKRAVEELANKDNKNKDFGLGEKSKSLKDRDIHAYKEIAPQAAEAITEPIADLEVIELFPDKEPLSDKEISRLPPEQQIIANLERLLANDPLNYKAEIRAKGDIIQKAIMDAIIGPRGEHYGELVEFIRKLKTSNKSAYFSLVKSLMPKTMPMDMQKAEVNTTVNAPIVITTPAQNFHNGNPPNANIIDSR